jgi:hypothetical protein
MNVPSFFVPVTMTLAYGNQGVQLMTDTLNLWEFQRFLQRRNGSWAQCSFTA